MRDGAFAGLAHAPASLSTDPQLGASTQLFNIFAAGLHLGLAAQGLQAARRLVWPAARVLAHIRQQSGRHFDPLLVAAFLKLAEADAGLSSRG